MNELHSLHREKKSKKIPTNDGWMQLSGLPFGGILTAKNGKYLLAWFWWHYFQTPNPFTEAGIIKMNKTAFQFCPLFCCQGSKLWKSCLLHKYQAIVT